MSAFEDKMADGAGGAVDSIWDSVFTNPLGNEESAFEGGGFDPLPRCAYLFKVDSVEAREVGDANYPTLHFALRVVKGPAGTVNRVIFDDLFLYPFARKNETQAQAAERLRKTLVRVRNAFRLQQERPLGRSLDALKLWARQFDGTTFTGVVRIEGTRKDEKTGREYDARNRLVWDSLGHPDAVYTGDEKKYVGQTYGARVDAEIAALAAKSGGGDGASGKTAGGAFGSPTPTSFFKGEGH